MSFFNLIVKLYKNVNLNFQLRFVKFATKSLGIETISGAKLSDFKAVAGCGLEVKVSGIDKMENQGEISVPITNYRNAAGDIARLHLPIMRTERESSSGYSQRPGNLPFTGVKTVLSDATVDVSIARNESNLVKAPEGLIRTGENSRLEKQKENQNDRKKIDNILTFALPFF